MDSLQRERDALRERQGPGARWDATDAPKETLSWARSGTAYFARLLNDLDEHELDGPSLVPGWSRRHIVALVGYQARSLTRLTGWAQTGIPNPAFAAGSQRLQEVEEGATLPDRALRGLFRHAAVHLDVEWRDLTSEAWDSVLRTPDGKVISARDTPWLRAREIWLRAVDLRTTGSFIDYPPRLVDRLIAEAAESWAGGAVRLCPSDRTYSVVLKDEGGPTVRGSAPDLARWMVGRGARRFRHDAPLPERTIDLTL